MKHHIAAGSRGAVSPVVSTVILVAISLVLAIAIAFWISGFVGIFTRFERLEIVSAYQDDSDRIVVIVRNVGTVPTSIIQITLNNVKVKKS